MRLLRLGDSASDLDLSDEGSLTASSEEESEDESDTGALGLSLASSTTSLTTQGLTGEGKSAVADLADAQALREFEAEVEASLARSFSEGHAVEDAAVELKTLRMASNVPLRHVREAVVAHILKAVPLVSDNPAKQRKVIADVVGRWGELINLIGGVDAVETVEVLQVSLCHPCLTFMASETPHRNAAPAHNTCPSLANSSQLSTRTTSSKRQISAHGMPCLNQGGRTKT